MQFIHDVVIDLDFSGESGVSVSDNVTGLSRDVRRDLPHMPHRRLQFGRHCAGRKLAPRQLCDVHSEVTRAFEVGRDSQSCCQCAQVTRDRLLASDEVDGAPLDILAQRINSGVAINDRFGDRQVRSKQRLRREVDSGSDLASHFDELLSDGIEFVVIRVSHAESLRRSIEQRQPVERRTRATQPQARA